LEAWRLTGLRLTLASRLSRLAGALSTFSDDASSAAGTAYSPMMSSTSTSSCSLPLRARNSLLERTDSTPVGVPAPEPCHDPQPDNGVGGSCSSA
jgi:hypothetical protein